MMVNKAQLMSIAILALIISLASSGSHPTTGTAGYTGAPGDSFCGATCHTGGNTNLDGEIIIEGLPTNIVTDQTYTITVRVTNPNGNAVSGGFQLVALTGTNTNAGSMSNNSANTEIKTVFGNKKYFGHSPATTFPGSNELVHTVEWTAPTTTGANPVIKFYASSVITNGNGQNSGDRVTLTNQIIPISTGSLPLNVNISDKNPTSCSYTNDGRATATASGGSSPYTFLWNNSATTFSTNTLSPGMATITVTDFSGSTATATTIITSPSELVSTASGSTVCNDTANGMVSAAANGGTGSYSYSWSNGENGSTLSNLSPGIYTVVVTDDNSCSTTSQAIVSASFTPTIEIIYPTCFNSFDGKLILDIRGNQTEYTTNLYLNHSLVNYSFDSIPVGNYNLIIEDSTFCQLIIENLNFQSLSPAIVIDQINKVNPTSTTSTNGSLSAEVSGGTGILNYVWKKDGLLVGTSSVVDNLGIGSYSLEVTDSSECLIVEFPILLESTNAVSENEGGNLSIWPNPISESIGIRYNGDFSNIEIYNPQGKLVFAKLKEDFKTLNLDLNQIGIHDSGVYFLKINDGNKYVVKKFVVIK